MPKRRKRGRGSSPCSGESEESSVITKKARNESKKKRQVVASEIYSETAHFIQNGLRHVQPYYFTFTTHAKGRWVGSKVIDVFCREFQAESPEYYERAIKAGKVMVGGVVATLDTVVKDNELITHKVHRHEPPVTATPLTIIHQDQELVVLDKPASIPVHPCGRYRHNSVVFLLAKEHNLPNLHTVHRLDRLTSGLLMFARSVSKAQQMETEIRERRVSKVYLCRVQGKFPSEPVECNEPIQVVTHKVGVCRVHPKGKECSTRFTRLSYNDRTSVVKCEPRTGRMHQIRVHLQWMGHPIVNDPIYNHPAWTRCPTTSASGDQTNIERIISEIVQTNYNVEAHTIVEEARQGLKPMEQRESDTITVGHVEDKVAGSSAEQCMCDDQEQIALKDSSPQITALESKKEPTNSDMLTRSCTDDQCRNPCLSEDRSTTEITARHTVESTSAAAAVEVVSLDKSALENLLDTTMPEVSPDVQTTNTNNSAVDGVSRETFSVGMGPSTDGVTVDPDCSECKLDRPDPSPADLLMFLHALSYKGEGWEFSTPWPHWAHPDWTGDKTD